MVPSTYNAVFRHTPDRVNRRIRLSTEANIAYYSAAGADVINQRIAELDTEWDIERTLARNAASVSIAGVLLGLVAGKRYFLLTLTAGGFLLQYAIKGWCAPVAFLRRMGMRTRGEIDREKYALKAARGDFRDVPQAGRNCRDQAQELLAAVGTVGESGV
jgi:hypothetical protein